MSAYYIQEGKQQENLGRKTACKASQMLLECVSKAQLVYTVGIPWKSLLSTEHSSPGEVPSLEQQCPAQFTSFSDLTNVKTTHLQLFFYNHLDSHVETLDSVRGALFVFIFLPAVPFVTFL